MKLKSICAYGLALCLALGGCAQPADSEQESTVSITYWMEMNPNIMNQVENFGETPIAKQWMEDTGINVTFIHPNSAEQFNLMLASNDLPDIIETNWITYPGGPEKALKENYIIKLNDIVENDATNLKTYLESNADINKMIKTDSGDYYVFPFVRGDESLLTSSGLVVRKDWLDSLSLPVPETIDEWTVMLRRFRDEKGASTPLCFYNYNNSLFEWGVFSGAYGVAKTFYLDDAQNVVYGPVEPGYKEFLKTMNMWYEEKLLDNNYLSVDSNVVDSSMLNGNAGATVGALGGGIGKWLGAATQQGYDLVGVKYPVQSKGQRHKFSSRQQPFTGYGAAISSKSENVEAATKFLNYCYSDKGHLLMNFGIENESYTMEENNPTYTELITQNPENKTFANILAMYTRANFFGGFVQDERYIVQYSHLPQQQEALKAWSDTDADKYMLPPITVSAEESSELARIMSDISTFDNEMTSKFIIGTLDIDQEWDSYLDKMKELGIDKAKAIYQQAYDRYISR